MLFSFILYAHHVTDAHGRHCIQLRRPDTSQEWRRVFDPELDPFDSECDAAAAAVTSDLDASFRIVGKARGGTLNARVYFVSFPEELAREGSES